MSETRGQDPVPSVTDPLASLRAALHGRYEIERQIGQGAYATVYLARDLKHERKVAIKVLTADAKSETGEIRFIREIRLVARLQHPNILPLHDSGHVETTLYYVMPYVHGETLRTRMQRERQMGVTAACNIARETADALAYAHSQGIVHRDIKPENILLSGGHAIVADFGIARAIDVGGVKQLTMTGMGGPGTPAYMSPEQLLGDRGVDSRSDIYSLGCVLYEMLAGKPPFPGKDGFVKRFTEPPPHISSLRRDAPPWLDETLAKALARDPADRYTTAADLVASLSQPLTTVRTPARERSMRHALASPPMFESDPLEGEEFAAAFGERHTASTPRASEGVDNVPTPSRAQRWLDKARANPLRSAVWGLGILAVGLGLAAASRAKPKAAGDTDRFAILPFAEVNGASPGLGSHVSEQLYDALSQWQGLRLVPGTRVAEAIRNDGAPGSENESLALAGELGAGKLIWGRVSGKPGEARVRVHLYDVASGQSQDEFVFVDSISGGEVFAPAAQRLLKIPNRPAEADGGDGLTRSYPAWAAYGRGHIALKQWNLAAAEREFRAAVGADVSYAPARLWLAQVLEWVTSAQPGDWQREIAKVVPTPARLAERDLLIASALRALAERRYPDACAAYGKLIERDSLDFVGNYGMGECAGLDSLVLPHASSRSGWRFRASSWQAVRAFITALRLEPGAHSILDYERLAKLLPTSSTKLRTGKSSDGNLFAAYPSLINDTLAFIPYPAEVFAQLPLSAIGTRNAALQRNSAILSQFAVDWTRQSPTSAAAHEALATALDASGERTESGPSAISSLDALRTARKFATDPEQLLRLGAFEVFLHVKRGDFERASTLADSLLSIKTRMDVTKARTLVGIAALTGRIETTASLAQLSGNFVPASADPIPVPIRKTSASLHAYAALGACTGDFARLENQLDQELSSHIADDERDRLRARIRERPVSMFAPCTKASLSLSLPTNTPLYRMQQAFARGRTDVVRQLFDSIASSRRGLRPGDITLDFTYQEAWLRAAIGDTAQAITHLDRALGSLSTLSATAFNEPGAAAALGRAMALRAELAHVQSDQRSSRLWGNAVAALWRRADQPLQPTVARMRAIAR